MPENSLLTLLICFTTAFAYCQKPMNETSAELFQSALDQALIDDKLNGVTAYVQFDDGTYWYGAAGNENNATANPMDTSYSFWAASCTKLFTSAAIFSLIDKDSIQLDDKLVDYISPEIPNINPNASIKHALQHTSGIAEFLANPAAAPNWYNANSGKIWNPVEVLKMYLGTQNFNPGSGSWAYSNSNFVLLGLVVEHVTGVPFAQYVRQEFLDPLQLHHTWFPPFETSTNAIAKGYSDFNQDGIPEDASFLHTNSFASMVFTAGGMVSAPQDLALFTKELVTGNLFENPTTLSQYLQFVGVSISQNSTGYGHGCSRFNFYGDTYFGHGGDINGYTNFAIHSPSTGISLGLMMNYDQRNRELVTKKLLQVAEDYLATNVNEVHADVKVYPNPAQDVVYFSGFHPDRVTIQDAVGKTVLQTEGNGDQVDISSLQRGVYVMYMWQGNDMQAVKCYKK